MKLGLIKTIVASVAAATVNGLAVAQQAGAGGFVTATGMIDSTWVLLQLFVAGCVVLLMWGIARIVREAWERFRRQPGSHVARAARLSREG